MSETTRKFYVTEGEGFEKSQDYEKALQSYLNAYSIKECLENDNTEFFKPGYIEDKIGFLAYRIGDFRKALTFGAKAYRAAPEDKRLKNNLPFYTDAILYTNPKERLDDYINKFLLENYPENYTVLDIGPYDGRWWNSLHNHFKHIDAVEAFEPYIEHFKLNEKYDSVFVSDIREFEFEYYDIIILGDVLEHMPIDDAQKLLEKLSPKCKQLLVIIPYEYPQDEYDNNKFQIHYQEDLTDEIFMDRYKGFSLLTNDEVRGAYVKKGTNKETKEFKPLDYLPKTIIVGLSYYNEGNYSKAAGAFDNSLEIMTDEQKALANYYTGMSHKFLGNALESMQYFSKAIDMLPSYKDALLEMFRILEKLEFWADLEHYLRIALEHKNETNSVDKGEHPYWENLILIQLTLALSKQKKNFEAYGFAALALDSEASPERKKIAEYNFNELKKELWSTLQIEK